MSYDPFRMTTYGITVGSRFRKRPGAPEAFPPVPDVVQVQGLPKGKVEFAGIETPSSPWVLTTRDFREIYDPAGQPQ